MIAVLGTLLALNSVGDGNATETAAARNVETTDTYAFFQAKNNRQTAHILARDDLQLQLKHDTGVSAAARADIAARIADYSARIDRYESEPDPDDPSDPLRGDGKVQLLARAQHLVSERDEARDRGASFDYGSTFATAGVVIASASLLVRSRWLAWSAAGLGVLSLLMLVNAITAAVDLNYGIG